MSKIIDKPRFAVNARGVARILRREPPPTAWVSRYISSFQVREHKNRVRVDRAPVNGGQS